ncbi:MAG TPA: glycosyltransferase family 9 protein [Catenuloplanes sp.]
MILALRALGVGDLLTAVPALRALRAAFPERTLALAAPRGLAPLVDLIGGVDRLLPVDGVHGLDEWRRHRWTVPSPAVAVNLHGRGPQSHHLLRAAAPGRLLAFASAPAGHTDGPAWVEREHEVARWCRLLRWYGIPADPADLDLRTPRPDGVPVGVTVVHPGAKHAWRRWPAERFASVARSLTGAGHRVVLTGSPAERDLALRIARAADLPLTAVLAGRTGLVELAALVAHARLLVSGDTGIAHLATAYRTRSVLLFGPMSPRRWGPPADRPWHRALWHGGSDDPVPDGGSDPDSSAPHPLLARITPAEVLAAAAGVERVERPGQVAGAVTAQ